MQGKSHTDDAVSCDSIMRMGQLRMDPVSYHYHCIAINNSPHWAASVIPHQRGQLDMQRGV